MNKSKSLSDTACLCIHIRRSALKVTHFYDRILSPTGLSINQYSLLINISRMEGCGTGELANKVRLEKSTLVRTLQPLLKAGYLEDRSEQQNRSRQLYLTQPSKDVLQQAIPLWEQAQQELQATLNNNTEQLMNLFSQLETL